jgi:hypothetical protein
MKIHAVQQPTNMWLRLWLVDLRRAIESVQPNALYIARDRYLEAVNSGTFVGEVVQFSSMERW